MNRTIKLEQCPFNSFVRWANVFLSLPLPTWDKCYKTFYGRNLWIGQLSSNSVPGSLGVMFAGKAKEVICIAHFPFSQQSLLKERYSFSKFLLRRMAFPALCNATLTYLAQIKENEVLWIRVQVPYSHHFIFLVFIERAKEARVFVSGKPFQPCVMYHTSLFGPFVIYKENVVLWIWIQVAYSQHFIFS